MTNLEKYIHQLRRIEEHREAAAEKAIRKVYKEMLQELNGYIADLYLTYSEDDKLTYGMLAKAGMDARFLEEVEQRINGISPKVASEIQQTVEQTYEACYDGMVNAVNKAAGNRAQLIKAFETVSATTPDVIKAAVQNPVSGLTLKDTLEKHRKEIIYDIKRNIGVGLTNGDRYSTMAKKIAESVDGDYKKAIRIVRTETHRVRETGFNDAATALNDTLKQGKSGYVMAKTWRTMRDERVRPRGQKGKKAKKYDHVKMDGVTIPQDDIFVLPSGATCKAPSQTGVAGEDINCRCYLSYDLVLASELTKQESTKPKKAATKPKQQKAEATKKQPQPDGGVDAKNLPAQFTATKAEAKNTQLWLDYINNVEGADKNVLAMFNNMAKYGDANTIPMKIGHGKNHAVQTTTRLYTGELVEVKVTIPKISGDAIHGQVQTMTHELTHYIDLLNRKDLAKGGGWASASNPKVKQVFFETSDSISDDIKELFADHKKEYDAVRKAVDARRAAATDKLREEYEGIDFFRDYTAYKEYQKKRKKIITEFEDERDYLARNIMGGGIGNLQDIYDALSGGKYRDTGIVKYGHGSKYYSSKDCRIEETLANYAALSVTRPDLIKLLKKDKPELCKALDELIEEIVKGAT